MPRFIDVHQAPRRRCLRTAISPKDVAIQGKYGVQYLRYWYGAATGKVFFLSEAPSKEAALAVHRETSGVTPDENIEVQDFE